MSIDRASDLLRLAQADWAEALDAHILAEPNPNFAGRLRDFAAAADRQGEAMAYAHEIGYEWDPLPSRRDHEPPYELSRRSGRIGPTELWTKFDAAYTRWDQSLEQRSLAEVAAGFAEISGAANALADAVERLRDQPGLRRVGSEGA
jgi:hypothetical protein